MAFKAMQYQVRREIKHKIKNSVPIDEQVVFAEQDLADAEWLKPNKEFRLKDGSMFDVIRKEGSQYFCIHDTQEEELFKYLDELVSEQIHSEASKSKPSSQKIFKAFKPDFASEETIRVPVIELSDSKVYFGLRASEYLSVPQFITSPPPEKA